MTASILKVKAAHKVEWIYNQNAGSARDGTISGVGAADLNINLSMLLEINHAATHILAWLKSNPIFLSSDDLVESFLMIFSNLLTAKYTGHWDPSYPTLGNGYRSISVHNGSLDSTLKQTAKYLGFTAEEFANMLPKCFVLWVDPMVISA